MEESFLELEGIFSKGYGFVAKSVMQDNQLSLQAKGIYAYLCSYSGKGTDSFPSRKKMCFDLNISNDTLGKYLKELKENGYISILQSKNEHNRFSNNVYTINLNLPCPKIYDTENSIYEKVDTNKNNDNKNINNNKNSDIYISTPQNTEKHKYGEYKNVLLTNSELEKLQNQYTNWQELITYLDEYIEMKGYKAKSHYLCIKKWVIEAVNKQAKPIEQDGKLKFDNTERWLQKKLAEEKLRKEAESGV